MKTITTAAALLALGITTAQAETNWTGFYVGAHAGYSWGDVSHAQTNGGMPYGPYSYDVDGVMGGVSVGYNQQIQRVVIGIEAEGGYMSLSGEGRIPSSTPPNYQALDVEGGFYALIAGRLGVAFDRTLVYGKAGYAYMDGDAGQKTTKPGYTTQRSEAFQGFVYGAGVEHKLTDSLSFKVEWLRFDFDGVTGSQTSVTDAPIGYVYTNKTDTAIDTVKLGLAYKF